MRETGGRAMERRIILQGDVAVACPKCNANFPLEEGISRKTIEQYGAEFDRTLATRGKALEAEIAAQARRQVEAEFKSKLDKLETQVAAGKQALAESKAQRERARAEARDRAREEFDVQVKALREEVAEKSSALDKSSEHELALRRQLREAEQAKRNAELEYLRKLDEERKKIEEQARAAAGEDFARREAQFKTQLESAQREAADLKRKLEQASQQNQGEALEVSLEEVLRSAFPIDEIMPVPKGKAGADIEQRVRTASGTHCGTILWEAKDTKAWSDSWLTKLKDCQRETGAEFGVIVTTAMPKDLTEPFARLKDVFVARFAAARPVGEILRIALMETHKLKVANADRGEKMEALYNYLCSPQFAQRMKAVVEGFAAMRMEVESEKAAMAKIWARREKQLGRMSGEMVAIVGELQGLGEGTLPQLDHIAALPALAQKEETLKL